jgi:signal transduction histidine kinase
MAESALRPAPRDAADIVFAICHEVGNLVGAIRLNADLIDSEATARELATLAVEIDDSSARIRSLLALVRPLLSLGSEIGAGVSPAALLRGVAESLAEYGGRGATVEVAEGEGLPEVRGRPETLHHLLVTLACYAVEEARPHGHVRITAGSEANGNVRLRVEDDGTIDESLGERQRGALTGRALACAAADLLLVRVGGDVDVQRRDGFTEVVLSLPLRE